MTKPSISERKRRMNSPRGAPASRRLRPASCRARFFANDQAIDQRTKTQDEFFLGSACVPQAAPGILPGAVFRE